jgi:hypothetical protein
MGDHVKGAWTGTGIAFGAAFGILVGLLLFDDWWLGPVIGAVVGLLIGAIADAQAVGEESARETAKPRRPVLVRWVAWFQLVIGVSILAFWAVFISTGRVPEIEAGERGIWFHVAAEVVTGLLLTAAGLRSTRRPARFLSALALGTLLYTSINSPGYYADTDEWPMVVMFGVLFAITAVAIVLVFRAEAATDRVGS